MDWKEYAKGLNVAYEILKEEAIQYKDKNAKLQSQIDEVKEENVTLKKKNTYAINKIREYIKKYHITPSRDYIETLYKILSKLEEVGK